MKTKDERKVDLIVSLESNKTAIKIEQLFERAIGDGLSFIDLYYEDYENFNLLESIVDSYKELGYNISRLHNRFVVSIY